MLLFDHPTLKVAFLLAMAVWGFARAYYFACYVVERYADREYKFAGLWSFARYLIGRRRSRAKTVGEMRDAGSDGP